MLAEHFPELRSTEAKRPWEELAMKMKDATQQVAASLRLLDFLKDG
jgi:hypothetical protein